MTLYLIRHAQSSPQRSQHFSEWELSPVGARQAEQLADLLKPLQITHLVSSPFVRSCDTAKPFAHKHALPLLISDDLREQHLTNDGGLPSEELWCKCWEDFNFCQPGCETPLAAQARICRAIAQIAQSTRGTCAIFTHGMVIALFLNALNSAIGRKEAEALTNPDVLKIVWENEIFTWDRNFRLAGLDHIATDFSQIPREQPIQIQTTVRQANP